MHMSNETSGAAGEKKGTVLVTGGVKRIGAAISRRLAARGWRVVAHTRDASSPAARALAAETGALLAEADLAAPGGAAALFLKTVAMAPDVAFLVNNASVFSPLADPPPGTAEAMRMVNAEAPAALSSMLGLRLLENAPGLPRRGAVVDILDAAVPSPAPDTATPYEKSKAALAASMEKAAGLFADSLRVNGVAPGAVLPPEGFRVPGGDTLLPERPSPDDVARAVEFFLEAGGVTAQTLKVDSGRFVMDAL